MKQIDALKKLAEKVEAKRTKKTPVLWFKHEVEALGWSISLTARAYNGSEDAASSLHKVVLGDDFHWTSGFAIMGEGQLVTVFNVSYSIVEIATSSLRSRAHLLAIIKAKISELE